MFEGYLKEFTPKLIEIGIDAARSSLRIILIIIAAYIGIKILRVAFAKLEILLIRASELSERVPGAGSKRIKTLMGVLHTIAVVLIWFVVVLISFSQVGINIAPILAGAGVVGLAVGFGAQNLVRDLVSGFFLILENQVRVGDVAEINGTGGLVESISFRTIVLRDLEGVVHVFPNGIINTLSNRTKEWSAYVLDVGVAYKEDTDRVVETMRRVAAEMQEEAQYGSAMLQPIEIFGVDEFADSAVNIKARLRTIPLQQWNVGREYRRRLKKAFDAAGIEIPFPHRTLYMGEASSPFQLSMKGADGIAETRN
jgi:moderate conductance mechanosensitive channel